MILLLIGGLEGIHDLFASNLIILKTTGDDQTYKRLCFLLLGLIVPTASQ